jgi:hypothetical protein
MQNPAMVPYTSATSAITHCSWTFARSSSVSSPTAGTFSWLMPHTTTRSEASIERMMISFIMIDHYLSV